DGASASEGGGDGNDNDNDNDGNDNDGGPPTKKKPKRTSKKKIPPRVLEARRSIQECCRDRDLPRALRIFRAALGMGRGGGEGGPNGDPVKLEAQSFYNLLNLCEGTFAERSAAHVGTPRTPKKDDREGARGGGGASESPPPAVPPAVPAISLARRLRHARRIHSLLASLNLPPIEPSYTALIRLSCRAGDLDLGGAEGYLDEAEKTEQCKVKLRMYSSLLRAYCGELRDEHEDGGDGGEDDSKRQNDYDRDKCNKITPTQEDLVKALKVWKRMHERSGGPSTGHPSYHKAIAERSDIDRSNNASENASATLFGEGISPKISLGECEYMALVRCATKLNDAPVMERLLSDVADRISIPGKKTTEAIVDWFRSDKGSDQKASSALDRVTLPPRADPPSCSATNPSGKGWKIYRDCKVDASTGKLTLGPSEGEADRSNTSDAQYRLKPVQLTKRDWEDMRAMNRAIVLEGRVAGNVSRFQGGGKGQKRPRGVGGEGRNGQRKKGGDGRSDGRNGNGGSGNGGTKSNRRVDAWDEFESFLRAHPPYDVVIDGANVGYFDQNKPNSPKHVDYRQIDALCRHLLERPTASPPASSAANREDTRVVLFLHERHFSPTLAPPWARPLFREWDGADPPYDRLTVYRTPGGMNDDWYWMHAALLSGGGEDCERNGGGERNGERGVMVVSNDEMRDHHFQMLARDSFAKWKERHRIRFDFGRGPERMVRLRYPNVYSRRIQRVEGEGRGGDGSAAGEAIAIPLPKRGDEGRFADGVHVADDEGVPVEETYVVIQRVV
ncbi:hypothetical protein ACHAWF_008837, partial [Thalassiosira exigua]